MTLKEEFEILRGEPIEVLTGDPMDIPCIETSDPEKLYKHPVVSVHMITYNHEPYIRQAIGGVMMQKTEFEFELVIGEDASQDKTREICFEYQKKYPDKIRVLWSEYNVGVNGNLSRTLARCRGEYIAFCEGDDYWTDPLKLQKQVDVMRQHLNAGLCLTGAEILAEDGTTIGPWTAPDFFARSCMPGKEFCLYHLNGCKPTGFEGNEAFVMTASALIRKTVLEAVEKKFEIFRWRLRLNDSTCWLGIAANSDVCFLQDRTTVYRRTTTGACSSSRGGVWLDSFLVRFYFMFKVFALGPEAFAGKMRGQYYQVWISRKDLTQKQLRERIDSVELLGGVYSGLIGRLFKLYVRHGTGSKFFTHVMMALLKRWSYESASCNLDEIYKVCR